MTGEAALVQSARELAPQIAAAADVIERERRLPEPLVQALAAAGLFHMLVPASLGGSEADLATLAGAVEVIAGADASTAWCVGQGAGSGLFAVRLDPGVGTQIWGDPRGIVAVGQGAGTAIEIDGGYRLSGNWHFASGARHATWMGARGVTLLRPDGSPRHEHGDRAEQRVLIFPAALATFTDVWQVSGLIGTGSDDYAVRDLFVPSGQVLAPAAIRHFEPLPPLYRFSESIVYGVAFASVALGIARATVEALVVLAQTKKPMLGRTLLRDDPLVQDRVARAEAELRSAHAFLHLSIANAWQAACRLRAVPREEQALLRLAITHAMDAGAGVVNAIYRAAGASAIFAAGPFERRFRDMNAVTQQAQAAEVHFRSVGSFLLGAETQPASFW